MDHPSADPRPPHGTDFRRLEAFSDGVMAIAITLLVLNIDLPDIPGDDQQALWDAIRGLWPDFLAYALSFAVIGRFWLVHHRFLDTMRRFDGPFVALNLLFLSFIGLLPFASEVMGRWGDTSVGTAVYAALLSAAALAHFAMIRYAVHAGLVDERHTPVTRQYSHGSALILPGLFLLSIPLAFLSPYAAQGLWVATFVVHPSRRARRRADAART